ncbi:MAG TPA: hypothetical protein DCQ06_00610 [Myxococcales bacterium]|nr:hypothetical protein [Myxococcales bacterium]HAN30073.1 hypothetical protein [Myxococcales bacterium]|tara:strand:- start:219 stop:650 length:432 start_codon:yes stop_codon:yes gene_type:complete
MTQPRPTHIKINTVEPALVRPNEPFKATYVVKASGDVNTKGLQVSFLTDDARLILCDHATEETPVEKTLQVNPGQRVSKTVTMHLKLRKGLRNEFSRDGSPAPLTLHARLTGSEGPRGPAVFSEGYDIEVAELAKRTTTKIFI